MATFLMQTGFANALKSVNGLRFIKKVINRFLSLFTKPPATEPVNFNRKNTSPESLQMDVEYAVRIARNYLQYLQNNQTGVENKVILEVGPGINFGTVLILACYGARVMVSDRFLTPWDNDYHLKFYSLLKDWVKNNMPDAELSPFEKVISSKGYPADTIKLHATSLEELRGIADKSVDVVFSNAVLEHIASPKDSFRQMARVSRDGALGFHQVDFRDHRSFERPLEFLLMDDREFEREFKERHGECGNRWRHWEYVDLFEKSGFHVENFTPNIFAENSYMDDFLPRLKVSKSKHSVQEIDQLKIVSGLFVLRKL